MAWVTLCLVDELAEGESKYIEVDGFKLAAFRNANQLSVLDSTCPHAGANLASGWIQDGCAVCPWHSWAFDLQTGQLRSSPGVAVTKYPSRTITHAGKEFLQAQLPTF